MLNPPSRTDGKAKRGRPLSWPRTVECGRESVRIYRRRTPSGNWAFMVANCANGKRRLDSYATEQDALDAAGRLARQLSERDVLAASLTNAQAADYAAAVQTLEPFKVPLLPAVQTLSECLKLLGDLPNLHAAATFYAARHKRTVAKRVADVVFELLTIKEARGKSKPYLGDLRSRLGRFAGAFQKDACNVTTAEVQAWLDAQQVEPQTLANS